MLLLSGIHCNFSFTDEFCAGLRTAPDPESGSGSRLSEDRPQPAAAALVRRRLLGASPAGTTGISVRNSSAGYKSACSAQLDYTSVAAYCESVNRCLETGLIAAPSELYTPVRLRFSEKPTGGRSKSTGWSCASST